MKKWLVFLLVVCSFYVNGQTNESKLEFSFGLGVAHSPWSEDQGLSPLVLKTNHPGLISNMELNIQLPGNRHFGIGYSNMRHMGTLNQGIVVLDQRGFLLDNYKHIVNESFLDIHLRRKIVKNLNFTIGFYYHFLYTNEFDLMVNPETEESVFIFTDASLYQDFMGAFAAVDYMWQIKEHYSFGIQSKLMYSFNGLEALSLSPVLRVKL